MKFRYGKLAFASALALVSLIPRPGLTTIATSKGTTSKTVAGVTVSASCTNTWNNFDIITWTFSNNTKFRQNNISSYEIILRVPGEVDTPVSYNAGADYGVPSISSQATPIGHHRKITITGKVKRTSGLSTPFRLQVTCTPG